MAATQDQNLPTRNYQANIMKNESNPIVQTKKESIDF